MAKTATIMIAFRNFNVSRLLSPQAAVTRLRLHGKQRFSHRIWMYRRAIRPQTSKSKALILGKFQCSSINYPARFLFPNLKRDHPRSFASLSMTGITDSLEFVLRNLENYSSITTGVPSSTSSNSSITSAFRILTQPQLAGVPILSSCFVP